MRHIAAPTVLVVVLTAVAGCSDGGGEPGGGESSASGSTTASSPATASGDPSSGDASEVAPATGVLLSMPHTTVRAPDGWVRADHILSTEAAANDPDSISVLQLQEVPAFGGTSTLDQLRHLELHTIPYPMTPKTLPNTELDGVEMYHLSGRIQRHNYLEQYGALVDDRIVTVSLQLSTLLPPGKRREIIDSVIATFRWK